MKNFTLSPTAKITLKNAEGETKTVTRFFQGGWNEAFDFWSVSMFDEDPNNPGWTFTKFELEDKETVEEFGGEE